MTAVRDDPRIVRGMERQFRARRARLDAGGQRLGWKVGFGAPAALKQFEIAGPLIGFMMKDALIGSGAAASLEGWTKPVAEAEIAVHMGPDLAIRGIGPAIELADLDAPPTEIEAILAGNIYHRNVILGRCDETRAGARLDELSARIVQGATEIAVPADLESNIGRIGAIVAHVADTLAAFGECLAAGDVIITGSLTPPMVLAPDQREVRFDLAPIDSISVRFTLPRP